MPDQDETHDAGFSVEDADSEMIGSAIASEADPSRERRQRRATRGSRARRAGRPDLSIVSPSAAEILSGSDGQLRQLAHRVSQAERAATRQTERARELLRRLNSNEPSLTLRAELERLRAEKTELRILASVYASGNHALGDELAKSIFPENPESASIRARTAERLIDNPELKDKVLAISALSPAARAARLHVRNPEKLVQEFAERAEQRRQYTNDSHGHRVRRDMLDSQNECPECKRENRRLAEQAAGQSG